MSVVFPLIDLIDGAFGMLQGRIEPVKTEVIFELFSGRRIYYANRLTCKTLFFNLLVPQINL